jgi:hypothetical protein
MKTKFALLFLILLSFSLFADTNTLTLTWLQPPGYQSTLYSATNLNGSWSSFGAVNPPYSTPETNQTAFFYVVVAPTNAENVAIIYTNDPNVEGLKPANTNASAIAYSYDGSGSFYGWSTVYQEWR